LKSWKRGGNLSQGFERATSLDDDLGLGLEELYIRALPGLSLQYTLHQIRGKSDIDCKYCISMQDQHYFFIFYLSKSEIQHDLFYHSSRSSPLREPRSIHWMTAYQPTEETEQPHLPPIYPTSSLNP